MSLYTSFAVAGAGPTIGARITKALLVRGASVVVLARPSSSSSLSPLLDGAKVAKVDYLDVNAVASTLREHNVQVVISALSFHALPSQSTIADAAKQAGVNLFVPSEYGMPTEGGKLAHLLVKSQFADYLKSLSIPSLRIYNGMFMEMIPSLAAVESGKFLIIGKGDAQVSTTSLDDVSGFIAHILTSLPPHKLHDATFRIQGERISLNQLGALYASKNIPVEYVTSLPDGYTKQAGLQALFNEGRGSSGWDNYADKDVVEIADSGNAAWPGHHWKSIKDALNL